MPEYSGATPRSTRMLINLHMCNTRNEWGHRSEWVSVSGECAGGRVSESEWLPRWARDWLPY
jgi:hypothetical protein